MNDPRRVRVTSLKVLGKDARTVKALSEFRPGFEQGFITAVAGSRQTYPAPSRP